MSDVITNYASAIISGKIGEIAVVLDPAVTVMPPGSNLVNEGKHKVSMMLSAVSAVVRDFRCTRTYEGPDMWYTVLLEGIIDDTPVQIIDQVHINNEGVADHIDIFLRPAPMAPVLLAKVTAEIQQRTTNLNT